MGSSCRVLAWKQQFCLLSWRIDFWKKILKTKVTGKAFSVKMRKRSPDSQITLTLRRLLFLSWKGVHHTKGLAILLIVVKWNPCECLSFYFEIFLFIWVCILLVLLIKFVTCRGIFNRLRVLFLRGKNLLAWLVMMYDHSVFNPVEFFYVQVVYLFLYFFFRFLIH